MSCQIQGSPEWIEMRRKFIGASDVSIIMGMSPYSTPHQLWEVKQGIREIVVTSAMTRGTEMEAPAREAYEAQMGGKKFPPRVVFHKEHKFMMCSLDGLNEELNLAVEIKNCKLEDHQKAKDGEVQSHFYSQLQHQMACLGHDKIHYWSFHSGKGVCVSVQRDDAYIEKMIEKEKFFFENYIEGFKEPPLTDRDYITREDDEWKALVYKWKIAKEKLKEAEEVESLIRDAIIAESKEQNAIGCGIRVTRSLVRGPIDYSSIPELIGVNLEQYRKAASTRWRLSGHD